MRNIIAILEKLSSFPNVLGCALVEADTGMVWHHAGQLADMESIGEAAIEFWRTQNKVASQLGILGELKFASYNYAQSILGLIPCDPNRKLVLVCLAQRPGMVWPEWMREIPALREAVRSYGLKQAIASP